MKNSTTALGSVMRNIKSAGVKIKAKIQEITSAEIRYFPSPDSKNFIVNMISTIKRNPPIT